MIRVEEALALVERAVRAVGPLPVETVALDEAQGRILRETVTADRDMPPFTRSAMDGYAVRAADTVRVPVTLRVIEEIPAGRSPRKSVAAGEASRIMTGAMIPGGADAVQMVESTRLLPPDSVEILVPVAVGENVRKAGEEVRSGAVLLEAGRAVDGPAAALLAACGRSTVTVSRRARVAILPTGDELVQVEASPGPSQIRETNGHALRAMVAAAGGAPGLRDIVPDQREALREAIAAAAADSDILMLSGGVSMGDYDLVGEALQGLGCRPEFTRVAIQPGKPLFFGTMQDGSRALLVFGLPGNPVSTVVDFLVFARPALRLLMGAERWRERTIPARLTAPFSRRPGRTAYLPAALRSVGGETVVEMLPTRGSSDMAALALADALAILPAEAGEIPAGFTLQVMPLRGEAPGPSAP